MQLYTETPAFVRFADVLGFVLAQLMDDFEHVPTETEVCVQARSGRTSSARTPTFVPRSILQAYTNVCSDLQPQFLRLLGEALTLQTEHGLYTSFPLRPIAYAVRALLAFRVGASRMEDTLDCAIAAFQAAKCVHTV
jgi:hypothetical protein